MEMYYKFYTPSENETISYEIKRAIENKCYIVNETIPIHLQHVIQKNIDKHMKKIQARPDKQNKKYQNIIIYLALIYLPIKTLAFDLSIIWIEPVICVLIIITILIKQSVNEYNKKYCKLIR